MTASNAQHPDVGKRIEVVRCLDETTSVAPGACGVVEYVDDNGTRHVRFDDGTQLGLVPGIDAWEEVDLPAPGDDVPPALRRRPQG